MPLAPGFYTDPETGLPSLDVLQQEGESNLPIATTPEEWRKLMDDLKGSMGPQKVLSRTQPGRAPPLPEISAVPPTGGLNPEQGMAPGEPPPGYSAMTPEGDESGGVLNTLASAASPSNRRAILRGTLGTAGTFAGLPLGPEGAVAGMFAGDFAGQRIANVLDSIYASDAPAAEKPELAKQFLKDSYESGRDTAIASAVGRVLPPILQNLRHPVRLFNRLMKLPPNSAQFFRDAKSLGVDLGVANLTGTAGIGGGAVNLFSRMPFMGTTAKRVSQNQAKQLVAAYNDMFGKVAPGGGTMSEIADKAVEEGTKRFEALAVKMQARLDHAAKVGIDAGAIVNTKPLKDEITKIMAARVAEGKSYGTKLTPKMNEVLKQVQQWPDRVDTLAIKNMRTWLENNARAAGNMQYPAIDRMYAATEQALQDTKHPAAKLMLESERFVADGLKQLQTKMMKQFGVLERSQYTGLRYKGAGQMDADQMAHIIENTNTPSKVNELRAAIGDDNVQAAARMRLEDAWEAAKGSTETTLGGMFPRRQLEFDATKFNKALGLDNMSGQKAAATQEMLRGTGVDIRDLAKLAQTAQLVANAPLGDPSTFVMRASVLRGGLGGVTQGLKHAFALSSYGASGAGAGGGGGLATAIMLRTAINSGLGALMRPDMVKTLIAGLDNKATQQAKIAALYHLFETAPHLVVEANAP
jgi:hypothetical protein